ncbi:MAG: beta-ketoacyl synthase chain length factor, partial [Deltaproteobacteria bacterium]|nr:beta-ketoacyl synthase chain length factor [Deltaproteobacteria bacterium]
MSGDTGLFATIAGAGLAHSVGGLAQLTDGRGISAISASADTAELAAALPGVSLRRIPHYARMALLAAVRALDDAGWRQASDLRDVALVMGTAYGSSQMSMDFMDSILDGGPRLSSPTAFSHAVNNMGGGLLSLLLNLQGPCLTVSQFEL